MKLIECYVNNFGTLSDFFYSFNDGLNIIQEDNGFGKSTLSAFIKSMLFGLEDTKKTGLFENDRKKYEPWQGGAWGGTLTISSGGEEYRIERSFNKKASLDETKIYELKTGKLTDKFSDKPIGEILLGIDREGFEKTVFLSERVLDEKRGINNISTKLSRLTGVAFDMTELDNATKLLEQERQFYYKKGGSGAISEITEKISELEYRKAELLTLEAKHEADAKSISSKEDEIKELRLLSQKELDEEKRNALKEDRYKEYKRKLSEAEELKDRKNEISNFFGGKIPEKETLYELNARKEEISRLNGESLKLESELDALPPSPTENEIDTFSLLSLKTKENYKKIQEIESEKLNTGAAQAKKSKLLIIFGAILSVIGTALVFASPAFLALTLLGVALLVLGLVFSKKNPTSELEEKLSQIKAETQENEKRIADFCLGYGISGYGFDVAIYEFKQRVKRKEELALSLRDKKERLALAREKCSTLIEAYPITNEYPDIELAAKIDAFKIASTNELRILRECEELKNSFGFSESEEAKSEPKERASDKLIEKERELTLLKNSFSSDETTLLELDEINASLEILKSSAEAARYKFETIKKAKSFLEAAKDSLTSKYLGKTREAFAKYVRTVSESLGEYGIDTSFAVTKTEAGATRVKESFSIGTQKLFEFALRLSFADSLYEDELPFLMLDDPFAYFDDKKLSAALALIKEISKERQIVYFTASKNRA